MRKKILSFILLGTLIFGVMPFNLVSASETLPEPVLSVNFDDETLNGGTVGIEEYGVEYGDGVNGKALYLSNRPNGNHLYGKAAQNFAEFSLPEGTLTTGNYTVSIWYRSTLSEFVEGTLLSNLIDANSGLNLYTSGAQQLQAKIGDSAVTPLLNWQTTPMTGVIADREWHNVAVSVDRNAKKSVIYIDGKVYAERNINIEPSAEIGCRQHGISEGGKLSVIGDIGSFHLRCVFVESDIFSHRRDLILNICNFTAVFIREVLVGVA